MNTTLQGESYEDKVYAYFSSLLDNDILPFAPKAYSKIFKHKSYKTATSREIICDITIETYNPLGNKDTWSSLVVIECKHSRNSKSRNIDHGDYDEFERKLQRLSQFGVKGIMVTNKGFTITEIEEARLNHIALVVLSDNIEPSADWIVSRDVNTNAEDMMPILYGNQKGGLQPVVYYGCFTSIHEVLKNFGIIVSNKHNVSIPFKTKETIKKEAQDLYKLFLKHKSSDPAGEILAKKYPMYRIDFMDMLNGQLATLSFSNKLITLSKELICDGNRMRFTLAHEVAHLELHEDILKQHLRTHRETEWSVAKMPDNIIKRMEIQANQFASYLLMPDFYFIPAIQKLFNIHRISKGYIYKDYQPCNQQLCKAIIGTLSEQFLVSQKAVEIRMLTEGWLQEGSDRPLRINEFL